MPNRSVVFDMPHAQNLVAASQEFLGMILPTLTECLDLKSVIDAGCGVGYYAHYLHRLGYSVLGFDGRASNIEEARTRYPDIDFRVGDIEDPAITAEMGRHDLVLCLGLLYHLENPFRAVRNIRGLANRAVLISTICTPERYPSLYLLSDGEGEDQALRRIALYPSEECVIRMLYRADFPFVYRFENAPVHEDFRSTLLRRRVRSVILASTAPLDLPWLCRAREPRDARDPWETSLARMLVPIARSFRLARKPGTRSISTVRKLLYRGGESK